MMCKKAPRRSSKKLFGRKRYVRLVGNKARQYTLTFLPAAKPSDPRTVGVVVGGAVW